jgi:hypothetical protein
MMRLAAAAGDINIGVDIILLCSCAQPVLWSCRLNGPMLFLLA